MSRSNFLLKVFAALGLFGQFIDDNNGAGGGDAGDENKNGDDADAGAGEENKNGAGDDAKSKKDVGDENIDDKDIVMKDLQDYVTEQRNKEAVNKAVSELKTQYPDFDEKRVLAHLEELNKTNPNEAKRLNNPLGWEAIHNRHFKQVEPKNDEVYLGRKTKAEDESKDILERVKTQGAVSVDDEAAVYSKLFNK